MIRRIQFSLYSNHYRYLTNEGIQYLRDYLHLPPEIVPTTLKRQARAEARPGGGERRGGERRDKGPEGDRAAYRRAPGGDDKAGAAGPGSAPMEFVSLKIFASSWF
jgi:small subunit ribosomal protein S10e